MHRSRLTHDALALSSGADETSPVTELPRDKSSARCVVYGARRCPPATTAAADAAVHRSLGNAHVLHAARAGGEVRRAAVDGLRRSEGIAISNSATAGWDKLPTQCALCSISKLPRN